MLPSDHSAVVYYDPPGPPTRECELCGNHDYTHGWLPSTEQRVCPGDWIVADGKGGVVSLKPDVFESTYERCADVRRR